MERKICEVADLKIMQEDDGPGWFSGYASTFSNFDRVGERPIRGAFTKHLAAFLRDGFIHSDHVWGFTKAIATIRDAAEDDHGLLIGRADFHSTPDAQTARTIAAERQARGKSVSLSIGYEVLADEYVEEGRLLKEVRLYEVSLVTVPANPLALVTSTKDDLPAGLSFADQSDMVHAAIADYTERVRHIHDLRAKEGRRISAATAAKIRAVLDAIAGLGPVQKELEALLAETDPDERAKALATWRRLHIDTLRLHQQAATLRGISA
jgi:HK97 family phage prohead protease